MRRSLAITAGIVCLFSGVLQMAGLAQEGAVRPKRDWSSQFIAIRHIRLADLRIRIARGPSNAAVAGRLAGPAVPLAGLPAAALTRLSFLPVPSPFAARPLAVRPAAADAWNASDGNWSVAGNWTAGVPTSSSAVTIGNTSGISVTEDLASASAASLALDNNNTLSIVAGNTLTVGGATTIGAGSRLNVSNGDAGGGKLNSGSLTNAGYFQVGNYYMTSSTTVNVTGTYTGTGGTLLVQGGAAGANALLNVTGAAPGTLTGSYGINATNLGSAAVEWGSGSITSIGDGGANAGLVQLFGAGAYMEVGATNTNSALKSSDHHRRQRRAPVAVRRHHDHHGRTDQ